MVERRSKQHWQLSRDERDKRAFVELRATFKKAINTAKEDFITREIDEQIESDSWHRAWHSVKTTTVVNARENYKSENGTFTSSVEETNLYLIKKYFPRDILEYENEQMEAIRKSNRRNKARDEPEVCHEEVLQFIRTLKKRKATAKDLIPNEAVETIFEAIKNDFLKLYQDKWARGVFPKVWKHANLVWILKKDGTPRPINLLPTLRKVLDRLVNRRLQSPLECNGKIGIRQFAYRQGTGTVDALKNYVEKLAEIKEKKK